MVIGNLVKQKKISVLLIEDDEMDASLFESLASQISQPSIELSVADELSEGLQRLKNQKFDIIVSDLGLPDARGVEVIQRLSEAESCTPILVLTGAEDDCLLDEAAHLGVYDYLYKADLNQRYLKRSIRYALSRFHAEEEKESLRNQLNQAQKMEAVGQLTGGIAHDFNNKLAIIQGNIEIIPKAVSKGMSIAANIEAVKRSVEQSAKLTGQLLAFSRKQEIQKTVIDLNDVAESSIKLLDRVVSNETILSFKPSKDLYSVEVDANQIDQVLMNLVLNARDAMGGKGNIVVSTQNVSISEKDISQSSGFREVGEYVCLSVSDNGPGISEENQKKIFEPFFTTKCVGEGTGLGLAVVHGIIAQHEAVIRVKSKLGSGTCFEAFFKKTQKKNLLDATASPAVKGQLSQQTILYVEDEAELRQLISEILREHDFEVIEAENGQDAIDIFKQRKDEIKLVATDMVMPKMTGMQLFSQLRSMNEELPFVFISGYSKQEISNEGLMPEKTRFITKPCSYDQLIRDITELLEENYSEHSKAS